MQLVCQQQCSVCCWAAVERGVIEGGVSPTQTHVVSHQSKNIRRIRLCRTNPRSRSLLQRTKVQSQSRRSQSMPKAEIQNPNWEPLSSFPNRHFGLSSSCAVVLPFTGQ